MCVCMSGSLPPDLHNLSPQNLAWAPHFTLAQHRARGRPKMLTPRVPAIVTPSEKPWRVKNWVGASKQKLLLGVGLYSNILFTGGSPKPRARRVHPTKWGVYALRIGRGPVNKSCSSGWVCVGLYWKTCIYVGKLDTVLSHFYVRKILIEILLHIINVTWFIWFKLLFLWFLLFEVF